ncbi:MAG: hypothetical protein K6U03_02000 [Firmicutes bacterium]|nr:hypothetical protein [Bacillota bacterium]
MSKAAMIEGFPVHEHPCPKGGDFSSLIADAYQAEGERFDPEMERADGDAYACRHELLRAAGTPRMRALAEKFIEAGEKAAAVRYRGFFMAGIAAGIEIALLAGLRGRKDTDDDGGFGVTEFFGRERAEVGE